MVPGDPASATPAPHRLPEPPSRCARLEQRARRGRGRRIWRRPGSRGWTLGSPGSSRAPARCPASARRAPQPGWGARLRQVSGPPCSAAAARELCRRLAPARSSCSSFPGNFRPGIPPRLPGSCARAAPWPGASARCPGRGGRLEIATAHSPPELGPLILRAGMIRVEGLAASDRRVGGRGGPGPVFGRCRGRGGPRRWNSEGAGPRRASSRA